MFHCYRCTWWGIIQSSSPSKLIRQRLTTAIHHWTETFFYHLKICWLQNIRSVEKFWLPAGRWQEGAAGKAMPRGGTFRLAPGRHFPMSGPLLPANEKNDRLDFAACWTCLQALWVGQGFATFLQVPTASEIRRIYVIRCFNLVAGILYCNIFLFYTQLFTATFIK